MTDTTPATDADEIPRGLARARQLIAKIEAGAGPLTTVAGIAAHAQAIATIAAAEAHQLQALLLLVDYEQTVELTDADLSVLHDRIRSLAGLAPRA